MENIHTYIIKEGIQNKIKYNYDYFIDKFNHLIKFYSKEDENAYLKWIQKYHKLDDCENSIYKNYYKDCKNKKDVINLTNEYRKIYDSIKNNGCDIIKMKEKYNFCILGINDGGNRLAILYALNIKNYKCIVNKKTFEIVNKFKLS